MSKDREGPAEIVNLRRARKAKTRADAAAKAAENRSRFGRPLAEKRLEAARETLEARRHEGHRLDRPKPDDETDPQG
ncbi:DUF4169 family protein [Zavarzinia compransoris]|uniref:DUF4169 domain-containing protein n=1 Tax=Zavarzinia compransoris TaxID=1264899 RepID=A0A317EAP0_9PROT|nr:DUF4169 family protein [Zavarzinia compransoris]PWR23296.1 DUF4169 domain-containing protein [Zavarzinia compransoris]TDP46133.1 uncharacterized protein DUF4169 [Zavarzinia compransoris]